MPDIAVLIPLIERLGALGILGLAIYAVGRYVVPRVFDAFRTLTAEYTQNIRDVTAQNLASHEKRDAVIAKLGDQFAGGLQAIGSKVEALGSEVRAVGGKLDGVTAAVDHLRKDLDTHIDGCPPKS